MKTHLAILALVALAGLTVSGCGQKRTDQTEMKAAEQDNKGTDTPSAVEQDNKGTDTSSAVEQDNAKDTNGNDRRAQSER